MHTAVTAHQHGNFTLLLMPTPQQPGEPGHAQYCRNKGGPTAHCPMWWAALQMTGPSSMAQCASQPHPPGNGGDGYRAVSPVTPSTLFRPTYLYVSADGKAWMSRWRMAGATQLSPRVTTSAAPVITHQNVCRGGPMQSRCRQQQIKCCMHALNTAVQFVVAV